LDDKYKSRYLDVVNEPLYPFGYGLSYTTFEYDGLALSTNELHSGETLEVSVSVANTGKSDGEEVVQLYIRDNVGSVTRPVKELKAFRKVLIRSGEKKEIIIAISEEDLKFYDVNMNYAAEPGDFTIMVGTNSRDVMEAEFTLVGRE
jgi:beta-glucosidase